MAFSFLYGYTVFVSTGDIARYKSAYDQMVYYTWADFTFLFTNLFNPDRLAFYEFNVMAVKPDAFALTVGFLTSRITENPRLFWGVVSFINTYLIFKFLNTIYKEI
ncbi:MAG: hypothetical protein KDC67_15060, partial [Ignavibacteriae bacterium]|nr:hypothetical protein [Ignavibacteriota bacterium]